MSRATFEAAYKHWGELIDIEDEAVSAALDAAECEVLDHHPNNTSDAAKIVRVLKYNLEAGGRHDRRDVEALDRLEAWLTESPDRSIADR